MATLHYNEKVGSKGGVPALGDFCNCWILYFAIFYEKQCIFRHTL